MVKVIETNLSIMDWDGEEIADHQSRVIEVNSWQDYIVEIKEAKAVVRQSILVIYMDTLFLENVRLRI